MAENEKAEEEAEDGASTLAAAADEDEPKLKGEAAAVVVVGAAEKPPKEKGLAGSVGTFVGSFSLLAISVFSSGAGSEASSLEELGPYLVLSSSR